MSAPLPWKALVAVAAAIGGLALSACGSGTPPTESPPADAAVPRSLPDARSDRAVVWAAGDGADGGGAARRVAALIARGTVDRFIYLGDVYDRGSRKEFARNYATTYGRLASRTAPTPGNHDWPNHRTGYDPYWRRALRRPIAPYYAFRAGGWEILSLNSETRHGAGSAQVRWIRSRVRRPGTCRIAVWHRPRFSAGNNHGDQQDTQPLWNAVRGHAAIVLTGHEHDMQRFKPVDGMTEFVSGAGGHGHYRLHSDDRLAFGNDTAFGALRLDLRPGSASYAFIDDGRRVLDRGTIRCRTT